MDVIGIVGNLISGAIGGNLSGAALKQMTLGTVGNTIAGAVGGVAGNYILQILGILSTAGLADMSIESMAAQGGSAAIIGAIVTAISGFVKSKIDNK